MAGDDWESIAKEETKLKMIDLALEGGHFYVDGRGDDYDDTWAIKYTQAQENAGLVFSPTVFAWEGHTPIAMEDDGTITTEEALRIVDEAWDARCWVEEYEDRKTRR